MRKNSASESGAFNPRVFLAFILCSVGAWLAMVGFASTPSSGTLTDVSGPQNYTAGPFTAANPTPVIQVDKGPECNNPSQPCDDYALTITLPAGYAAAHPNAAAKVTMSWTDAGSGKSDYDLYIYKNPRSDCTPNDCTTTDGSEAADYQSASSNNPEIATISPLLDGTHKYTVVVLPYTPTGETVNVKIELLPGAAGGGGPAPGPFGGTDPTVPGAPRYLNFYAPPGTSAANAGQGEFNIGFDPMTGRIMTMNIGPIWRLTPPELLTPKKPECCEALWEDKSNPATNTGLDPILWTDQKTGRTFSSNSTAGANFVYGYTDAAAPFNDGDQWVPVAASPPNGGADHETIGSGPYPAALSALSTPVNQGEAVYYCSQDVVGPASCQRSDTLGASYGPGVLAYNGQGSSTPGGTDCGGLHGHVHVAPDGTTWLPVNQCGGVQGGAVSTDGGITWTEFKVTGSVSQQHGADPSIALDADSTAYYAYVNNEPVTAGKPPEGHAHVKVSKDGGKTWINDVDLGTSHGIVNAAEIEAVGGSSGRAAVGFPGTNVPGDYQALSFPGKWYAFIATTYDGGKTWVTVNATPNDPVQSMTGIWQQGGSAQDRNLLDFNEITVDSNGRVLYGYSDGCVTTGCIAGTAPNDFTAYMRVARQSGGKGLFASKDTAEPVVPKPPCLSGTRDSAASHLSWKAPDNGGSDITNYQILRGTASGSEVVLVTGQPGDTKTTYDDLTALPSVPDYFYVVKAFNALGISTSSNEVDLKIAVTPPPETRCALPGLTILTDATGDELDSVAGHDVQRLSIGEPFAFAPSKLVFTLKMQSLATVPPDTRWPITFNVGSTNYTVRMTNSPPDYPVGCTTSACVALTPIFQYGPTAGPFVTIDPTGTGNTNPSTFTPDGTITIVVPTSGIGNPAPSQAISGFLIRITANLVGVTITPDNMPDSLAPSGSYTLVGNAACAPNAAPTALLTGTPQFGPAPLVVNFSGAGSTDPDVGDTIASYTFSFGDGSPAVTQSSPTISHTYNAPGEYAARLTVTDSHGLASTNTSVFVIDVDAILQNISTRAQVLTGDNVLIGGFIITGTQPKKVIVRAIGPSVKVNGQPVPGAMQDPTLELHDQNTVIATNDNWKIDDQTQQSQQAEIEATGIAPTDDRESALMRTLNAGSYTVVLRGKNNSTGIAVVEAYDLDSSAISQLANISSRGLVQTGDNVMIGGFIAGPSNAANTRVVIRGIGPSLSNFGVPTPLQDPTLELHNSNGDKIATNDNWKIDDKTQQSQQAAIQATGLAPSDDRESAILIELAPGAYTAILAGKANATGIGLVEIYNIP
jgi:hypothetical protein